LGFAAYAHDIVYLSKGDNGGQVIAIQSDDAKSPAALLDDAGRPSLMQGTTEDFTAAKRVRSGSAPVYWFKHDGTAYVVRDAASLARVRQTYAPVIALYAAQTEVINAGAAVNEQQAASAEASIARDSRALADSDAALKSGARPASPNAAGQEARNNGMSSLRDQALVQRRGEAVHAQAGSTAAGVAASIEEFQASLISEGKAARAR
jgi:hypothetical protein